MWKDISPKISVANKHEKKLSVTTNESSGEILLMPLRVTSCKTKDYPENNISASIEKLESLYSVDSHIGK